MSEFISASGLGGAMVGAGGISMGGGARCSVIIIISIIYCDGLGLVTMNYLRLGCIHPLP